MKYSKQRELIFNAVKKHKVHPTADMIYSVLKTENPNLSLGTVYRNLNQLSDNGDIIKVKIPGGADRFDCTVHEHYHFVCESCGKILDIEKEMVFDDLNKVIDGNEITACEICLKGICKDCK